jgi:hypothetical protein
VKELKRYAVIKSFVRQHVAACPHLAPPLPASPHVTSRDTRERGRQCTAPCDGSTVASPRTRSHTPRTCSASYTTPLFYNRLPAFNIIYSSGSRGPRSRTAAILHRRNGPLPSKRNNRFPVSSVPSDQKESARLCHRGSVWYARTMPRCRFVVSTAAAEAARRRRREERFLAGGKRQAASRRAVRVHCRVQVKLCCELLPQDKPR